MEKRNIKEHNQPSNKSEIKYNYKPNIRSLYKKKNLEKNEISNEKNKIYINERKRQKHSRLNDDEFNKQFKLIKMKKKISLSDLYELLKHNETNIDFLNFYFNTLYKENKSKFIEDIKVYYPILPIQICKTFNIDKKISEKERLLKLYEKISKANYNELNKIIIDEFKFPKELEKLNFSQEEKKKLQDGEYIIIK